MRVPIVVEPSRAAQVTEATFVSKLAYKRNVLLDKWEHFTILQAKFEQFLLLVSKSDDSLLNKAYEDHLVEMNLCLQDFLRDKSLENIVDKMLGFGTTAATFLISDGDKKVVVKLPYSLRLGEYFMKTEQNNLMTLLDTNNSPDFVQKLSLDTNGKILSIEGKVLATDLLTGTSILDKGDLHPQYIKSLIDESQIPELMEFYIKACKNGVPLLDVGGIYNTLFEVTDNGRAKLKIFDFATKPDNVTTPTFKNDPLAGCLHHLIVEDLMFEGLAMSEYSFNKKSIGKLASELGANDFYDKRFDLLINGLKELIKRKVITAEDIVKSTLNLLSFQKDEYKRKEHPLTFYLQGLLPPSMQTVKADELDKSAFYSLQLTSEGCTTLKKLQAIFSS